MFFKKNVYICIRKRGISSVGRALGSQSRGQGFDPPILHKKVRQACRTFLWSIRSAHTGERFPPHGFAVPLLSAFGLRLLPH